MNARADGMHAGSPHAESIRPDITVSSLDAIRLQKMIDTLGASGATEGEGLLAELDRAAIVAPADMPPDVVTMNSTVRFRVDSTGSEFSSTLVYPRDKGEGADTLSVLAPVGSALLGLREGDRIAWPAPGGATMVVRIIEVTYQPERAGALTV